MDDASQRVFSDGEFDLSCLKNTEGILGAIEKYFDPVKKKMDEMQKEMDDIRERLEAHLDEIIRF
jgi:hypothetical protein